MRFQVSYYILYKNKTWGFCHEIVEGLSSKEEAKKSIDGDLETAKNYTSNNIEAYLWIKTEVLK